MATLDSRRRRHTTAPSAPRSEVSSRVVVDGLLTTSRGPGTAFEFALSLVKQLYGPQKAAEVAGPMVLPDSMKLV